MRGGKQGRFVTFGFPCFTVFVGPKITTMLGKITGKVPLSHPFLRYVLQMVVKTGTSEQCPQIIAGKAQEK